MFWNAVFQVGIFLAIVAALGVPSGLYRPRVFAHEPTFLDPVLEPIERLIYRVCRVRPGSEMTWGEYAIAMLVFSMVGMLVLYAMQRLQAFLPLNPQKFAGVPPDLAFNTNWQAYGGESTMSYLTQMAGLAFHNFISAAAGIAIAIAVIRGFVRRSAKTLGNFWVDLTRAVLWVLLPISVVFALVLVWQGVPDNFSPYVHAKTVEGAEQVIAEGPVASQEIIKELGTNGGGFFNANSAHPYEDPTPLAELIELVAIFAIGAGLTHTFGHMAGDRRQGWALFGVMAIMFLMGVTPAIWAEQRGNPQFAALGLHQHATAGQSGGNMEGKETRFGTIDSALWATVTTDTSCGAVNSMHDSFTPLGGLVPLANIMLSEVVFGGVGSGLYGMVIYVVLAVFIAGLMVGRTPEYLGKKIEAYDVKMAMLTTLVFPLVILGFTAVSVLKSYGTSSILNPGPHGFSEIIYAYTEGAGNNGSAFGGLTVNTLW